MLSVSPTFKGFTPIGLMIVGAAVSLAASGAVRVGLCELRASGPDQCQPAWDSLTADLRASGLGIGGLLAQSPVAAYLSGHKRRQQQGPKRGPDGRFLGRET
jgi:hypothetical protein